MTVTLDMGQEDSGSTNMTWKELEYAPIPWGLTQFQVLANIVNVRAEFRMQIYTGLVVLPLNLSIQFTLQLQIKQKR